MTNNFKYLDDECTKERPATMDNLLLAFSASDWLDTQAIHLVGLCNVYKHPELKCLGWKGSLNRVNNVSQQGVYVSVSYYSHGEDNETDLVLPITWFNNGESTLKSDIAALSLVLTARELETKAKTESDKAQAEKELYKALHQKYAGKEVL